MNSLESIKALFPGNSLKMGVGGVGIVVFSLIAPLPESISQGLIITGVLGIVAMLLLIVAEKLDKKYQVDNTRELARLARAEAKVQRIKDEFGVLVRDRLEPNVNQAVLVDSWARDKEFKEWEQEKLEKERRKEREKATV